MALKDYLTTFELLSDRERAMLKTIGSCGKGIVSELRETYREIPSLVKKSVLIGALLSVGGGAGYTIARSQQSEPELRLFTVEYQLPVEVRGRREPKHIYQTVTAEVLDDLILMKNEGSIQDFQIRYIGKK